MDNPPPQKKNNQTEQTSQSSGPASEASGWALPGLWPSSRSHFSKVLGGITANRLSPVLL